MIQINKKFCIDEEERDLCYITKKGYEHIRVTKTQFLIVITLLKRTIENRYTTRQKLEELIYSCKPNSNVVIKHIQKLRDKIGKRAEIHSLIEDRHGFGYRLKTN